ncbi:MAG: Na+/H+ antiporter subunit D [Cyclobacteriaceae bacterium]|nr:Na+/H+ antiporter subunit D [Cyclobacteriaceae bacterium]MCH8516419.1 Na+/H+ antiporter subunit D [Cyclobacteriaceae bacterium]
MKENLIIGALLSPFVAGIIGLLPNISVQWQKRVSLLGTISMMIFSSLLVIEVDKVGVLSFQAGGWEAPYGISIVADRLSALMVLVTSIIAFPALILGFESVHKDRKVAKFFPIFMFLILGISGSFLTGDVFNLFVWFEIMLISSFVLLVMGNSKKQVKGTIKYLAINVLSSTLFLVGIGVLYGIAGSVNMAHLALVLPEIEPKGLVALSAVFFFVAFGIKAAIFPVYFWLPSSYHTPSTAATTIIGALLTKVGIYTMLRFFSLMYYDQISWMQQIVFVIAAFTMISGGLGALAQTNVKKLFSFSIISQIGYMVMGVFIGTAAAFGAVIYFLVHNILVKGALFIITGIVGEHTRNFDLKKGGGIAKTYPLLAVFYLIVGLSLVGIPPLSGFWGKFGLLSAGIITEQYWIISIALAVSVLTILYFLKVWNEYFWKAPKVTKTKRPLPYKFVISGSAIVLSVILIAVFADPIINYCVQAGEDLFNKNLYIKSVLGDVEISI